MRTVVPGSHGQGLGLTMLESPCRRWYYGHTGVAPGYVTFAAGSQDGSRMVVVAVNGLGPGAVQVPRRAPVPALTFMRH